MTICWHYSPSNFQQKHLFIGVYLKSYFNWMEQLLIKTHRLLHMFVDQNITTSSVTGTNCAVTWRSVSESHRSHFYAHSRWRTTMIASTISCTLAFHLHLSPSAQVQFLLWCQVIDCKSTLAVWVTQCPFIFVIPNHPEREVYKVDNESRARKSPEQSGTSIEKETNDKLPCRVLF